MRNFLDILIEKILFLKSKIEFQEEVPENEIEAYKVRIRNHKKAMYVRTAFFVILAAVLVLLGKYLIDHHRYSSYKVVTSEDKTDNISNYEYAGGEILRYSSDGASLLKTNLDAIWNVTFTMSQPAVDICEGTAAIYDKRGTSVYIYNAKGQLGTFSTGKPILYGRVTKDGNFAAALEDGDTTWINYYTSQGSEIATVSTNVKDPGSPVALSLSHDGLFMAVSYLTAASGGTGTHLVFYNFGSAGKEKTDNEVAAEDFSGTVIPEVEYLSNTDAVAFRDNGFTVYKGSLLPKKTKSVDFDGEVVSTFYDSSHMGFIFKTEDTGHKFVMKIYTTNGNLVSTSYVDLIFDKVRVCGDEVIFFNNTQMAVYSMRGFCRFSETLDEGEISDVLKTAANRYFVVTDMKAEIIKLT